MNDRASDSDKKKKKRMIERLYQTIRKSEYHHTKNSVRLCVHKGEALFVSAWTLVSDFDQRNTSLFYCFDPLNELLEDFKTQKKKSQDFPFFVFLFKLTL